jgi:hypothetical protein
MPKMRLTLALSCLLIVAAAAYGEPRCSEIPSITLDAVGHYPAMEAPDRFAAIVANYIETVPPLPPAQ